MSAPQIPNLNSLRRGGLRGRGRGQGASGAASSPNQARKPVNHDQIVQNTDNDAVTSRLSAVEAGYLDDPFAKLLSDGEPVARRLPLMNRGTYARTHAVDRVVDTFLSTTAGARAQIISLGAGSDTRFFRLRAARPHLDLVYHEIDFEANTRRKVARLRGAASAQVRQLCGWDSLATTTRLVGHGGGLVSDDYVIHAMDLRSLATGGGGGDGGSTSTSTSTSLEGVDTAAPTLLISECCLVYLPPDDADGVLRFFDALFPPSTPLGLVVYEPVRPDDAFGRTMVSNLLTRGIQLQTLQKYKGLEEQVARLRAFGFAQGAAAADMDFVWREWVGASEKERVERLEWMDEVEEFVLLARHYCVAWGWRGGGDEAWSSLVSPVSKR